MEKEAKIYVAGHNGLVGSALVRALHHEGHTNIITRTRADLDLCNQQAVDTFFAQEKPDYVFLAAAKVGGILANRDYPADFIYQNLMIECNIIHAAYKHGVKKLLFLGSSCIYPRDCPQPIKEAYLLTAPLEETNKAYAIAKIAGLMLCESYKKQYGARFIACMPTNLYGPEDNYHLQNSHVAPALLRKIMEAQERGDQEFAVWGTGTVRREFLYVDDFADAALFLMNQYEGSDIVNVGTGIDCTIRELVETIKQVVGYEGIIQFDATKPDGTPRKLLDVSVLSNLGWKAPTSLTKGIEKTYAYVLEHGMNER
jgi:GDP-L-fucose synthase